MVFGKKIASSITVFGLFWICVFGQWHTVDAKGDDTSLVPVPEDNISIWDTGTTSVNDPYNAEDLFEYSNNFWGDLFDDGRFDNVTVSDNQRYLVELGVSKFVSTHADEEVNGVMTSYFDDIVDYVMAHPSDFDMYWTPDGFVSAITGNPYMNLQFGEDFYGNLYDYVIANYYTTPSPSGGTININGHTWYATPYTDISGYYITGSTTNSGMGSADVTIYYSMYKSGSRYYDVWCTWSTQVCYLAARVTSSWTSFTALSNTYTYDGITYYYSNISMAYRPTNTVSDYYNGLSEALADFYGNFEAPSSEPVSNGKVYIREQPIGGNTLTVSYPALPVSDSKAVSNYYYETYGDTFEDSTTNIDNRVYNNNTTTVYPITYSNDVPLWLVERTVDAPSLEVVTADYSLPSVELEEGDASFWQGLYEALPVSVSVILLGVILCWLIFTLI